MRRVRDVRGALQNLTATAHISPHTHNSDLTLSSHAHAHLYLSRSRSNCVRLGGCECALCCAAPKQAQQALTKALSGVCGFCCKKRRSCQRLDSKPRQ